MKKYLLLTVAFFLLLTLGTANAPASHEAFLPLIPPDNFAPGWVREGSPQLCADENCLSQRINGAAPYYFNAGLYMSAFQYYLQKEGPGEINLEIFWMKTFEDAKFLYNDQGKNLGKASPAPSPVKLGKEGRLLEAKGLYFLEYYIGPYFIRIEARGEGPAPKEALLKMAGKIAKDIEEGTKNR